MKWKQSGFTLVEVAITLLIVAILLGYTVAMFPQQQKLKQYRAVKQEMDRIIEAVIGFAQVNGRLPCPALPDSAGSENNDANGCGEYAGFVPANTLGLDGRLNADALITDPWGNPYRYYVTFNDDGTSDFAAPGQMRIVGLVDSESHTNPALSPGDGYLDLDGRYLICDDRGTTVNSWCASQETTVFGRRSDAAGVNYLEDRYGGAAFVLLSMGQNWNETPVGDELENSGATTVTGTASGNTYRLKDVDNEETTFVRRITGHADDFDDVVRWVSPHVLFSRMIQAGQLP